MRRGELSIFPTPLSWPCFHFHYFPGSLLISIYYCLIFICKHTKIKYFLFFLMRSYDLASTFKLRLLHFPSASNIQYISWIHLVQYAEHVNISLNQ